LKTPVRRDLLCAAVSAMRILTGGVDGWALGSAKLVNQRLRVGAEARSIAVGAADSAAATTLLD
jgi:hypothetical protein